MMTVFPTMAKLEVRTELGPPGDDFSGLTSRLNTKRINLTFQGFILHRKQGNKLQGGKLKIKIISNHKFNNHDE